MFDQFLEALVLKPYSRSMQDVFDKGIRNEARIARHLPKWVTDHTDGSIMFSSLFECGLTTTARAFQSSCATSPDLFAIVRVDPILDLGSCFEFPALIEMKTAVAAKSSQKLQEHAEKTGRFRIFSSPTAEDLRQHIPKIEHRAQLLHHCAVLGIEWIFYVEAIYDVDAAQDCIVSVKFFKISENMARHYLLIINKLRDISGFTAYYDALLTYPDKPESLAVVQSVETDSYLRDPHTISIFMRLGKLIRSLPSTPPCVKKCRPLLVQTWNWTKGLSIAEAKPSNLSS